MNSIDPNSGFEIYWGSSSIRDGIPGHSLVKMSNTTPIKVVYCKPQSSLGFDITPHERSSWNVRGIINREIAQSLRLFAFGYSKKAPLTMESDISIMSRLGEITIISGGTPAFSVNIRVSKHQIYSLFSLIWKPSDSVVPKYYLGGENWDQRILPQKHTAKSTITVINLEL